VGVIEIGKRCDGYDKRHEGGGMFNQTESLVNLKIKGREETCKVLVSSWNCECVVISLPVEKPVLCDDSWFHRLFAVNSF
jgi:hypothetical protein